MNLHAARWLGLSLATALLLSGCGGRETESPSAPPEDVPAQEEETGTPADDRPDPEEAMVLTPAIAQETAAPPPGPQTKSPAPDTPSAPQEEKAVAAPAQPPEGPAPGMTIEEAKAAVHGTEDEPEYGCKVEVSPENTLQRLKDKYLVDGGKKWPRTEEGLSYGPAGLIGRATEDSFAPDLVGVVATNGVHGYAKYQEYAPFSNQGAEASGEKLRDIPIPVYDLEGNVVGEFVTCSSGGTAYGSHGEITEES